MPAVKITDSPVYPCDICGQKVEEDEEYIVADGGLTVEHLSCASGWFRDNFGREDLG